MTNDIRSQIPGGGMPFITNTVWAMLPSAFENLRDQITNISPDRLAAAVSMPSAATQDPGYEIRGGVAVIPFSGVVSKNRTLMGRIFGGQAVATETQAAVNSAATDPAVGSILLVIDSPGGMVDGTAGLADTVAAANAVKPVTAYCEDQCCSAAYWVASQAGRVVGNSTASVGSIGVFAAVPDISRLAKNAGVEMHVIRSAAGKGSGTPGAPVTDSQLADLQTHVDAIAGEFIGAVARGRGMTMEAATALADGRVHVGKAAVALGLLDGIEPLSTTLATMQEAAKPRPMMMEKKEIPMATLETPTPAPVPVPVAPVAKTVDYGADITAIRTELSALTASKTIDAVLAQGVADRKITPGLLETAKTVAKHGGPEGLKAFVASLPVSAPDGGSVTGKAKGSNAALPPKHRFDAYGPSVWANSTNPAMLAYGAQIEWIAAHEAAGNPKFKNAGDAFKAYSAAHVEQTRVA